VNQLTQLALLILRGLLLWIVIPIAALTWVVVEPVTGTRLGSCIGWFDQNLLAFIQRVLLRPFVDRKSRVPWTPFSMMSNVEHRVGDLGFWR